MRPPTLISLFVGLGLAVHGQAQSNGADGIDLELARFVAGQQVQRNHPPLAWRSLDAMVLHDVDGKVAAYALVFAKAEAVLRTPAELHRHIREKAFRLRQLKEKAGEGGAKAQGVGQTPAAVVQAEQDLYGLTDLATVITGATAESPLILRHFRGLPEFWVQAETFEATGLRDRVLKKARVAQVIMITPADFRLALTEQGEIATTQASLRTSQAVVLPDSARVLKVHGQTLAGLGEVRAAQRSARAHQEHQVNRLNPGARERFVQALNERKQALADQWKEQGELWQESGIEKGRAP